MADSIGKPLGKLFMLLLIITACIRRMGEGNSFTLFVCPRGVPHHCSGGTPIQPLMGRYPHHWTGGTPYPTTDGGYPHPWTGGTPIQSWMEGTPT